MKKNATLGGDLIYYIGKIMRYSVYLVLLVCSMTSITLAGETYGQQLLETPVTLQLHNVTLGEALDKIARQTRVQFVFVGTQPRQRKTTSIRVESQSLEKVLGKLLSPYGLYYQVVENRIVIRTMKGDASGEKTGTATPEADQNLPGRVYMSARALRRENIPFLENIPIVRIRIDGRVIDDKGEPLPGVSILVKGTQQGMITDANGQFSIDVPDENAILVFSFVGYISQEVLVGKRNSLEVRLASDQKVLEELVVIGYGTAKKSDLTGSVARVNADVFRNQNMTQLTDMLTGTVAGFNANQSTSAAGGSSMEIRGPNSINAGTSPMIVLDGVVFNGSIRDINPNDIETIDILKDASSAAVFGARAASGVVLVTTVKGKSGKPKIGFSSSTGVAHVSDRSIAVRSPQGYLDYRRDLFRTNPTYNRNFPDHYWFNPGELPSGISLDEWRRLSGNPNPDDQVEWLSRLNFWPVEIENLRNGTTTDWAKEVLQNGRRYESNVSVSGGTPNSSYFWSLGYVDNDGVIRGDKYKTVRSRLNVEFKIAEWLRVGTNTQFSFRDQSSVPASLSSMSMASPYSKPYDANGKLAWFPNSYRGAANPLINTLGQEKDYKINNIFSSIFAEFRLPLGLSYRVSFQPRIESYRDYNYWSPETITGGETYPGGRATRADYSAFEWMLDNIVKWNKSFGNHSFDLTLLQNAEHIRTWLSNSSNQTFQPSPVLGYSGLQFGTNPTVNTNDTKGTGDALMARLNYSFKGRYLLTTSLRRDGYSAFGQENPRAIFPAAALAWQLSEEAFFNNDNISFLKLRASWGKNGNRDIGIYSALSRMVSNPYFDGTNLIQGVSTSTLANSGLKWEETESINLGVDLGMFNDRVNLTLDYYDMKTKNLLVDRTLPLITGFSRVTTNIGELGNKGFELTLNTVNLNTGKFLWKSDFNFSLNRNKIRKLFGDVGEYVVGGETRFGELPDYTNKWFPGHSIDRIWDYDIVGVWQVEEADEASTYTLFPGDFKVVDQDNNGKLEALQDKNFIGYKQPRFRMGLRNHIEVDSRLTVSFLVRADIGHLRSFSYSLDEFSTFDRRSTANYPYWSPDNRSDEYPRLSLRTAAYGGGIQLFKPTSFLRLQDISMSYRIPEKYFSGKLDNFKVFGSVRNLLTFSKWPGWDPESGNDPMPRIYSIGLNIDL